MRTIREGRWPLSLAALLAASLSACGGGGGGGGNGGGDGDGGPASGALTGVFVDAPVAGLSYTCGDDTGTTTANGEFRYDSGDTCTFSAGAISLGDVLAQATITPREVAAAIAQQAPQGSAQSLEVITQNLFQLLQSLDTDGDTSNGISLPANIANVQFDANLTNAVTLLNRTPEAFQAQVGAVVTTVIEQIDVPLQVVSVDAAIEHAAEQSRALLSGTWNVGVQGTDPLAVAITFFPNGTYLFGGKSDDEVCVEDVGGMNVDEGGNGSEFGRYTFDPLSGELTTEVISDSTGSCGFSDYDGDNARATLQVVGERLRLHTYNTESAEDCLDEGGADATDLAGERVCRYELTRALGTAAPGAVLGSTRGLEGSYVLESDLALGIASVLTIEQTGSNAYRYLLTESYGNNNAPDEEGATDGIAIGTFTVGQGNVVTINETYNSIGGDGGLGAQPAGLQLSLDSNRNLVFEDEDSEFFVRLPLSPRIAQSQIVGTFFPREPEQGGLDTQDTEPFPAFLSIFEDGEYLLGTYEDDADCQADSNPETTKTDCNGVEYGRFELDTLTGWLHLRTDRSGDDPRYADTNGIGGLVDDGNAQTSDRFFLRPLGTDGEILMIAYRPVDIADDEADVLYELADVNTVAQATAFAAADPDARFFLVLRPVVSTSGSLEGAWRLTSVDPSSPALVREDGKVAPFVLVFQNADEYFLSQTSAAVTFDGIEFGNYELRENGTRLCVTGTTVDTLPDSGLAPSSQAEGAPSGCVDYFGLSIDGDTATVTTLDAEPVTLGFTRISKPSLPATP